jgi:hypothetical protein
MLESLIAPVATSQPLAAAYEAAFRDAQKTKLEGTPPALIVGMMHEEPAARWSVVAVFHAKARSSNEAWMFRVIDHQGSGALVSSKTCPGSASAIESLLGVGKHGKAAALPKPPRYVADAERNAVWTQGGSADGGFGREMLVVGYGGELAERVGRLKASLAMCDVYH